MKRTGFTLLEVLFILSILSIVMLLTIPVQFSLLKDQQAKHFFHTFHSDILFIQDRAFMSNEYVYLSFDREHHQYTIKTDSAVLRTRDIPENWTIDSRTLNTKYISFTRNGTIRTAGTMAIKTENKTYKIVFPPGKGGEYIATE